MAKDQLARGARSATYGNAGVGESPLLRKIQEQGGVGMEDRTTVEVPIQAVEKPTRPRKKFNPVGHQILVRQSEAEYSEKVYTDQASALNDKSKDLVIIRDEEAKKNDAPAEGIVVVVGPGSDEYEMIVKPGDRVVFGKYSGAGFNLNGEWLLLMGVNEVLGTLVSEMVEDEVEETFEAPDDRPSTSLSSATNWLAEA